MKKKLLFCIQNLDIGGPQKSLLALLYEMNFDAYEVDLIIWSKSGDLIKYIPKQVNIIDIPDELAYLRISPEMIREKTISLIKMKKFGLIFSTLKHVLQGIIHNNMNISRQKFWVKNRSKFPMMDRQYDTAIAYTGGNMAYFIADCVHSKRKITWVRTDYRVLNRDKNIDRIYFEKMDAIVTISNLCRDILIEEFSTISEKTHVIYNLIPFKLYKLIDEDTSIMGSFGDNKLLLSVARLDPNKGFDMALDAMNKLKANGYKVKWLVLGDGRYKQKLISQIKRFNLESEFILLGFKNNPFAFISKCDIFIHPSRFEGKSVAIDEAKIALKPIVVTNFNTVSEQITHMQNGIVTDMNGDSLYFGIKSLLDDENLAIKLIKNLTLEKNRTSDSMELFYKIIQ